MNEEGGSTAVVQQTHDPKFEGSNPGTAESGRDKIARQMYEREL